MLSAHFSSSSWLRAGWIVAIVALASVRIWNALRGPLLRGYDDLGHAGYFLYLHFYAALPWADQGWSYFHPPLHYFFGWALTGFGSPEVLLRGVALLGGAASLGIAALAARVVERTRPGLRGLPLLAFTSVGLLPVYLYTGTMAGNELSATFLGTLALALFVTNECRDDPTPRLDALVGLALGLALLTKFSGALFAAAVGLGLLARGLRAGGEFAVWRRLALRGAIVAGIALLVCAPYYARNVREFGTPFRLSRDTPHVAELESRQLPGSRTWRDFVRISPKLFVNPRLEAPHLVRSVWGSAYAQTWADARNEWDILHPGHPRVRLTRSLGVCLGLLPSLLALVGAGLALGDVRRRRRVEVYTPLLAIAALTLVSFALFAWQVPQFSATKASYLLGLTLPYAAFLCRALEGLACAAPRAVFRIALALVVLPAAASAAIHTHALVLPAMRSHEALGALRTALGDVQGARVEFYQQSRRPVMTGREVEWSDNFAALWLLEGDAARAADTYARHRPRPGEDPFRWNAIGVANALAGRTGRALRNFDRAIAAGAGEVALVNRGAVRATLGQLEDAERDLREALALDSRLAPAWHALAEVLSGDGRASEAGSARERAAAAAARGPRGYPYGIPDGLGQWPSFELGYRFLLWLEGRSLRLAHAPFRAQDASAFAAPPPAKPNLVLVVIDTLRADHVGAYGYGRPTTPRIDALARRGVRFARASAPSSWTLPSVASIFTSLPPPEHGAVAWGEKLLAGLPTLAEALRAGGYTTLGVSANLVHVTEESGLDRGFDAWATLSVPAPQDADALLSVRVGDRDFRARAAGGRAVNARVRRLLPPAGGKPLFLYVHYMEPHSGYDPPEPHRSAFVRDVHAHSDAPPATSDHVTALARGERQADAAEQRRLVDLYDGEIASVDAAVGGLLDTLERRGFGDSLVVAVVSDHGEAFGEHGSWFHGATLHGEALAVPFVVFDSRQPRREVVRDDPVDLLDVAPTLLSLAGLEPPPSMRGRALLGGERPRPRPLEAFLAPDRRFEEAVQPRVQRRAVTRWPWKLIVDRDGQARAYQLDRDPEELEPHAITSDLPSWLPATAAQIRQALESARDVLGDAPIDPDELERLRALGYAR